MKIRKAILIAAATALAAMALASSASAVTVCSGSGTGAACGTAAHGKQFTGTYQLKAKNASLSVTNASGMVVRAITCTESLIHGQITNATTGAGTISSVTFSSCSFPNCTGLTFSIPRSGGTPFPWAVTITASGLNNTNGLMHITGPSIKFSATCSGIAVTCEYEAATATAEVKGGAPASVVLAASLEKKLGPEVICGTKLDWNGTYETAVPTSLYIE